MKKIQILTALVLIWNLSFGQARWENLGASNGLGKISPNVVHLDSKGVLYAAGDYYNDTLNRQMGAVCKWDGTKWVKIGNFSDPVNVLKTDSHDNLYAGGDFANSNGLYVSKWDGNSWTVLPGVIESAFMGSIEAMFIDSKDNIYVGGTFTDRSSSYVSMFNGNNWSMLGSLISSDYINAISINSKDIICVAAGVHVYYYNGTAWEDLNNTTLTGTSGNIQSLAFDNNGALYAGGAFTDSLDNTYLAKFNGVEWTALKNGSKLSGILASIRTIVFDKDNNIYVGGGMDSIMKYSNNAWAKVPAENRFYFGKILSMCMDSKNVLYVAAPGIGVHDISALVPTKPSSNIEISELNKPFSVYPNPSKFNFQIYSNLLNGSKLKIMDCMGRNVVDNIEISNGVNYINDLNLRDGLYTLIFISEGTQYSEKILIE